MRRVLTYLTIIALAGCLAGCGAANMAGDALACLEGCNHISAYYDGDALTQAIYYYYGQPFPLYDVTSWDWDDYACEPVWDWEDKVEVQARCAELGVPVPSTRFARGQTLWDEDDHLMTPWGDE